MIPRSWRSATILLVVAFVVVPWSPSPSEAQEGIEVVGAFMDPPAPVVGEEVLVGGTVLYTSSGEGVPGAVVQVSGPHMGLVSTSTDSDGWFTITIQAPLTVDHDLSLEIIAADPVTMVNSSVTIQYSTREDVRPPSGPSGSEGWDLWTGALVATVIVLVVIGITYAAWRWSDRR